MSNLKSLLGPIRIPFLVLTPSCLLLGLAIAVRSGMQISWQHVILVAVGALSAHISVNAFNEYFDFKSGLDERTTRTPFSGGSGTLQARPDLANTVLVTAWTAFIITALVGIFFITIRGAALLPIGVIGLAAILAYTKWITRHPMLCLVTPGLCFGPIMVMGTDFALTGLYSSTAFTASLVPFFLVNDLLLLNQFPDAGADLEVGRKHFPIVIGKRLSSLIYTVFLLLAYASLCLGVYANYLPTSALVGLITISLALPAARGVLMNAENSERLTPYMGLNVVISILTPLLIAAGIIIW